MKKVNHVFRFAMIVMTLVITLFAPLSTYAAPAETDQQEESWWQRKKQGAADRLLSSDSKLAQKVGGWVQGDPEQKRCKPLAQEALATFEAAWQQAFDDPTDLVVPAPHQWPAAVGIYLLIVVLTLVALKRCKSEKGWSGWGIILVLLFMSCTFTEVRVAMWGDEIKPRLTPLLMDFEQQCPAYKGQVIELATHKTWAARGADAAKAGWAWAKSWVKEPEEEPEEEMGWFKWWTYGDVRESAFEKNRETSPFFTWWAGMLIMLGLNLWQWKWWKGLWARRKSMASLLAYLVGRESTPPATPAVAAATPVVQAAPAVPATAPPAPQAPADAPIALPPKDSLPPAQAGGPKLVPGYVIWDKL